MSLADEYTAILAQISALEQPRAKGVGLPKDSAAVAKKLIELQARAQQIKEKLESQERIVRARGEIDESKLRLASQLETDEMIAKAALGEEEWNRRQQERAAEFQRQHQATLERLQAKAAVDAEMARLKADIERQKMETKGLNEALLEETRQQTAIRRLGEIRRVASDTRILRMGPDSEPVKALVGELIKSPELQAVGGIAVAQEILTKSQAVHQKVADNVRRVATKMFADRGYADKIPPDLDERITTALKTGGNVYQYTDKTLSELQRAEIEQKKAQSPEAVQSLKRKRSLKTLGIGAGSVILAGMLAKKIFGDKEQPSRLPPEVQMALAAQIQQAQGGEEAAARQTSRTLGDIGKLLSIIKVLQGVGSSEAQVPVSAGSIL